MILPDIPKDAIVDHSLCGLYTAADVPERGSEGFSGPNGLRSSGEITSTSYTFVFVSLLTRCKYSPVDLSSGTAMMPFVQVLPDTAARKL